MKTTSVVLLLGLAMVLQSGPTVSPVSLKINPNIQQFLAGRSVSLSCEEEERSAGMKVKRRRGGRHAEECGGGGGGDFGSFIGSSCTTNIYRPDSGVYWCETGKGERSEEVNITVSDGPVILEIPALPVMEGSDVTLYCKTNPTSSSTSSSYFFKDNVIINPDPPRQMTIHAVRQADEGFYKCQIGFAGESAESWLAVRAPPPFPNSSFPSPDSPPPPPFLPVLGVLLSVFLLALLLIGGLFLRRKQAERSNSPPADLTYADVTIRQAANRKEKDSADTETVYSDVKKHTAVPSSSDDVMYADIKHQKKKQSRRREAGPDPLYSDVKVQSGPSEVTYSQIVIRPQRTTAMKTGD